tara:strand:- start:103 stop:279 length:177 start_codon:yes stop_codon:yes gene_type:complete
VKLVFLFLFLSLLSCSSNNTKDYLNKNLNLDYEKDYSIEEYEKILKEYNDRRDFPNIN